MRNMTVLTTGMALNVCLCEFHLRKRGEIRYGLFAPAPHGGLRGNLRHATCPCSPAHGGDLQLEALRKPSAIELTT